MRIAVPGASKGQVLLATLIFFGLFPLSGRAQMSLVPAQSPAPVRVAQLHADIAQLNTVSAQLQQALDKAGPDKLSLDVVRLSQQVQELAQRIEQEVRQP